MPMVPGPAAAVVYTTLKVAGYGLYSMAVAKALHQRNRPILFGFAKTGLGLGAGLLLLGIVVRYDLHDVGDFTVLALVAPVRFLIWLLVLKLFFDFRGKVHLALIAALAGTALSYALDGVMWMLYRVVPGMELPFC